jgi:hypothetical protein
MVNNNKVVCILFVFHLVSSISSVLKIVLCVGLCTGGGWCVATYSLLENV